MVAVNSQFGSIDMDAIASLPWGLAILGFLIYWLASSIENQIRGLRDDLQGLREDLKTIVGTATRN